MTHTTPPTFPPSAEDRELAKQLAEFLISGVGAKVHMILMSELIKSNVSLRQYFLLNYLASEENLTMSDIAKKMSLSTAAATGIVDKLEGLQLVERQHGTEDRRKIFVSITSTGRELIAAMRTTIGQTLQSLLTEEGE